MSQELKNRTKKFALDVIGLCATLPHLPETRHAINQLIRSSSSVAANYRSACRGKSKADFIAKLGIVEEEADESGFWLEMRIPRGKGAVSTMKMLANNNSYWPLHRCLATCG